MFIKYPSPDTAVKSPVLRVDCQSIPGSVNPATSIKDKFPDPSVLSKKFALPSALGNTNVSSDATVAGALSPT